MPYGGKKPMYPSGGPKTYGYDEGGKGSSNMYGGKGKMDYPEKSGRKKHTPGYPPMDKKGGMKY